MEIIGKRFGKWVVVEPAETDQKTGHRRFVCRCDCGGQHVVYKTHLLTGKSAGCKHCSRFTHRGSKTNAYKSWLAMIERCTNPNHHGFDRYGWRGIRVCDRWMDFSNFIEDMGERPSGMSIERVDNDLGYFKENCKWADRKEQANNTSGNRSITYQGKVFTVAQLAEHLGLAYQTLYARIIKGTQLDAPLR